MNSKERYLKKLDGKKSQAIIDAEYRIENRSKITEAQKQLIKEFIRQDHEQNI